MKKFSKKSCFIFSGALFLLVFSFIISSPAAQAQYQFLAPIPTNPSAINTDLSDYMKYLYVAMVGLAIVLAVIMIVIGGIQYVTAAVPSAKEAGKSRVSGAILGLILALMSYLIIDALNPKLGFVGLNLSQIGIQPQGCNNDGTCNGMETNATCPADCPVVCNDGRCDPGETKETCPSDCTPVCGDGKCNNGETKDTCPGDCKALNCTAGKCANTPEIANAIANNCAGVDPSIMMAIIQGGEGCAKRLSGDGKGSCGYGQLLPDNRKKYCGLTGQTAAQTCAAVQNDITLDMCCTSKMMAAEITRCGSEIRNIAACWNTGKVSGCPYSTKDYCGRVEKYYNSCKK